MDDIHSQLRAWLEEEGYQPDEIEKILKTLQEYEDKTQFLSNMDSLDNYEFGINAIIAQALGKTGDK